MSFADTLVKQDTTPIHLLSGQDSAGRDCYWFLMCSAVKFQSLKDKINSGSVDLEEYGKIIRSGIGKPSQKVLDELKTEYDFRLKNSE